MSDFDRFEAMSFDCYGTLIDWETGIANALRPWARRNGLDLDDQALIAAHGRYETHVQDEMPSALYPVVLGETLRRVGAELGAPVTDEDAAAYGASVKEWPAFPDTAEALQRLATKFKLIILSNIDRGLVRGQRPAARRPVRRNHHRGGCRLVQATTRSLRPPVRRARPSRRGPRSAGARCRELVPRPRACGRARPAVSVDPPPSRQGWNRRNRDTIGRGLTDVAIHVDGRVRRRPRSPRRAR